ncbi:MAG: hypothetical protein EP323_03575 [Gammaproteobacteria bacterium]|nr:MAG: hypothetical protein EP323_03575 [Gammaproteobacteria bacterium]
MLRMLIAALTLSLLLAGCATSSEKTALQSIEGKPISHLVSMFGEPDGQSSKDGGTLYYWQQTEPSQLQNVKKDTAFTNNTIDISCRLNAYTDSNDVINKAKLKGDYYVCGFFTHKLSSYRRR